MTLLVASVPLGSSYHESPGCTRGYFTPWFIVEITTPAITLYIDDRASFGVVNGNIFVYEETNGIKVEREPGIYLLDPHENGDLQHGGPALVPPGWGDPCTDDPVLPPDTLVVAARGVY